MIFLYSHCSRPSIDGRFINDEVVSTVQCDQGANTCAIDVPAPAFALVFLNNDALAASEPSTTATFATTTFTGKGQHPASTPTFTGSGSQAQKSGSATPAAGSDTKTSDARVSHPIVAAITILATLAGIVKELV